ncbi:MAG: pilus assembly protein PilP [Deltaproteobacteria bacterium]|nr:pilus assembly protein PilP [Deltaproteobacteria bacterium]
MMHLRRHGLLVLVPALLLVAACGDDAPPPAAAPPPTPAAALPPTATGTTAAEAEAELEAETTTTETAEAATEAEYVYNPIGKRDPFRSPYVDIRIVKGPDEDGRPERERGPLQRWGVEQLQLRATITGTGSPMAMLVDPENVGHVVRRGALVGKNWGKVTAIRGDCIVITEQLRDASGAVTAVKSQRCLPKTDREIKMEKQLAKGG